MELASKLLESRLGMFDAGVRVGPHVCAPPGFDGPNIDPWCWPCLAWAADHKAFSDFPGLDLSADEDVTAELVAILRRLMS